jgi:YidC/Oxa1 family membrane protein insertase
MKKLKDIQPQIEQIKEKYKDDKERASREIFELYRREKINPFSGCLPMLIQIPIFIALYQALLNSIDLRHAPFVLWIKDLSSPETLFTLRLGGWAFEFHLLPVLMGATFLVQQLISPQTSDDLAFKLSFNYIMPIMFIFILWNAPAGLHLYWITMNILSILHQIIFIKK